jgi:hypothetical protein
MEKVRELFLAVDSSVFGGEPVPKTQTITVKARGLYDTGNNPWTLPDGALLEAVNVEIGRDNAITPRRGMDLVNNSVALSHLFKYGDNLLAYNGPTNRLYKSTDLGTTWSVTGSYIGDMQDGANPRVMPSTEASKSVFIGTDIGTMVIDSISNGPGKAGMRPSGDLSATLAGAGTAVPNNTRVAYRAVLGRTDANGRVILSTPSSRMVLTNTAGSVQNVTIVASVGNMLDWHTVFIQIYRTAASADQNTDPGDECYLVQEQYLGDYSAATVTLTDSTPDGLGGASLYTNPSQDTILGGNEIPPLAYDIATFGGSTWYADTTFPAQGVINLLGVSGSAGLALNDTVSVTFTGGAGAYIFTAKAAETIASREFMLATGGTADQNIRDTTASLIRCINRYTSTAYNVIAVDVSEPAPSGIPGAISFAGRFPVGDVTIAVSRATAWSPSTGLTLTAKRNMNGLVYSKQGQPDAIATSLALSPILVGSALEPIKRIIPTRNSLWVLKTDGIWRVTGQAGQYDVQPFDPTTSILCPKGAVALDNQAYFLADAGVVRVSESGVEIISRPEEQTIRKYSRYLQTVNAVARETDHKYILWSSYTNAAYPDTETREGMVFDNLTDTWTSRDDYSPNGAVVNSDTNQLIHIDSAGHTWRERRNPPASSGVVFGDQATAVTISSGQVSIGGGSYTVAVSSLPSVVAGDLLHQVNLPTAYATITGTLTSPNRLVVRALQGSFVAGAATVYASYPLTVTYSVKSSTPGVAAEWQEACLLFGNLAGDTASLTLTGDSGSDPAISIDKTANPGEARQIRVWPGRESSYSGVVRLSYSERVGYELRPTELSGVAWTVSPQGEGVSR